MIRKLVGADWDSIIRGALAIIFTVVLAVTGVQQLLQETHSWTTCCLVLGLSIATTLFGWWASTWTWVRAELGLDQEDYGYAPIGSDENLFG